MAAVAAVSLGRGRNTWPLPQLCRRVNSTAASTRASQCLGAAGEGNLIRRGEGYAEKLVAQKIRIGTHRFGGLVTETAYTA